MSENKFELFTLVRGCVTDNHENVWGVSPPRGVQGVILNCI